MTVTAGLATAVVVAAVVSMLVRGRPIEVFYARWLLHNAPAAVVTVWMGRLVLRRRARHGAGLVLLAVGAVAAVHVGVTAVTDARLVAVGVDDLAPGALLVPAELPLDASIPLWVMSWLWVPIPVLAMTMLLLVFPDGQLPGGGWRWVPLATAAGAGLFMLAFAITTWPATPTPISSSDIPVDQHTFAAGLATVGGLTVLAAALGSVGVLVGRWRRARGDQRRPFRAVGTAAIVLALAGTLTWPWQEVWRPATLLAQVGLLVTYGMAVARYRLHDLDPVLSRAAVAAILAAGVTATYLTVVVGVGSLIGRGGDSTLLPLVAVGAVAVLIEPARRQAHRLVERLLYGRDTDRAQVLSQIAALGSTTEDAGDVVAQVAGLLVRSTGAQRAEVWLDIDGQPCLAAAAGTSAHDDPLVSTPVVHRGEPLGRVHLYARQATDLVDDAEPLVGDVTGSLGIVLHNARLTGQLREQLEELQRSRQRLVEVHDETRRGLERDIHDGAQARLIGLRLRVGAARALAGSTGAGTLGAQLDEIGREVDAAVQSLRELARGLYPPVLEESGVTVALQVAARSLPLAVVVQARGVGRYPQPVEAAVYFACLEALQNAVRHAQARRITVRLDGAQDTLRFAVVDDGVGFDPAGVATGTGLANIHDRVAALGGRLRTTSAPGAGTEVAGELPAQASLSER